MKKHLITLLVLLTAGVSLHAKEAPKFLTVDMGELYSKYHKAIEAEEKFSAAAKNANDELQKMYQEGMELGKSYEELKKKSNNPALNDSAKKNFDGQAEATAEKIRKKQTDIAQYQQQASQTLAQRRQSVVNLHMDEIKKVLATIAEKRGAELVLNSAGPVVMYSIDALDITKEAIIAVNKSAKK